MTPPALKIADQAVAAGRKAHGLGDIALRQTPTLTVRGQAHNRSSSHHFNFESSDGIHKTGDDAKKASSHHVNMIDSDAPDWHLKAWAALMGKRQSDLVRDLGWDKNAAFRIWHGHQPYRRDHVNALSAWLGIQPHELLMPPEQAMNLRKLRETAQQIAKESGL